jgi:RNA recognition motif-containing protein
MSIYVGNLSYDVTEDDLNSVFAKYGEVKRFNCQLTVKPAVCGGVGFVELDDDAHETAAIDALDGAEWMGRDLKVNKAKPRENRNNNRSNGFSRKY